MVNTRVILEDGLHHPVDSSELAFKLACIYAFRQAYEKVSGVGVGVVAVAFVFVFVVVHVIVVDVVVVVEVVVVVVIVVAVDGFGDRGGGLGDGAVIVVLCWAARQSLLCPPPVIFIS